ncbi:MAG: YaaR family protein [Treponema sp.]|jgi:uncharacterized protein YaaR (DUF327 family)|nr:YaaR family protein [Treponema sp.]
MANIDFPQDLNGVFLDPLSYAGTNPRSRAEARRRSKRSGNAAETDFSSVLERSRMDGPEAAEAQPVSEETVNRLLEELRSAGDTLRERPFPQEILAYKKAVRNFMRYVVDNGYQVTEQDGLPKYLKPGFSGTRGSPDSLERTRRYVIQVVDRKLEELAATLLSRQLSQLELLSRLEEIRGLLVDLVS